MINNTNFAHWDRLKAKSLNTQFSNEMVNGLNCSPFEAKAIVEKVHEIYTPLWEDRPGPKLGQIQMVVVDTSVAPNVPLAKAKQRVVTLTLQAGMEDLANLFNCGVRTLVNDLRALRRDNLVPPLRSTIKDMGRAVTHRRLIIQLWLEGFEYSEIARKACHSLESVTNYVDKFKRCVTLFAAGFDLQTTALLVNISSALAQQFQQIGAELRGVPHRLQELEDFLKKNRGPNPRPRSRR